MTIPIILVFATQLIMAVVLLGLAQQIADIRRGITDMLSLYTIEENADTDYFLDEELRVANESASITEIEQEEYRTAQQEEFDQRIAQIKDELGSQQVPNTPRTVADVLHPDVENLPHDSIIDYETNPPDVEYSK